MSEEIQDKKIIALQSARQYAQRRGLEAPANVLPEQGSHETPGIGDVLSGREAFKQKLAEMQQADKKHAFKQRVIETLNKANSQPPRPREESYDGMPSNIYPIAYKVSRPERKRPWICRECGHEVSDTVYGYRRYPDTDKPVPCRLCSPAVRSADNRRLSDKLITTLLQQRKILNMQNLPANASRFTLENYPARGDQRAKKSIELFIEGKIQSMVLVGLEGRGKTGLAISAAKELAKQGKQILFLPFEKYIELLTDNFSAESGEKNNVKQIIQLVDYLIVDDFAAGSSTNFPLKEALILVDARENAGLKTCITCNYHYDDLIKFYTSSTNFQPVKRLVSRLEGQYKLVEFSAQCPDLRRG